MNFKKKAPPLLRIIIGIIYSVVIQVNLSTRLSESVFPNVSKLLEIRNFDAGFNGDETAFAHIYLRPFKDYCTHLKLSHGILFLDVASAFATLLRRSIFKPELGDEVWLKQLHDSCFSKEDIDAFYSSIKQSTFLMNPLMLTMSYPLLAPSTTLNLFIIIPG